MSAGNVHNTAQTGFGTGTNDFYDKARPSYPVEAIKNLYEQVRANTAPGAPLNILEVGSGTGIFTRALLAEPNFAQHLKELKAIEPSEGMRATFDATTKDARVSTLDGTFEHTGVEDGWADLVIVAQAFHWCPDYDAAMVEFARASKPTGIVAFIWNLEDSSSTPWVAQLRGTYEKHEKGAPQFHRLLWRAAFDTAGYKTNFSPPQTLEFPRNLEATEDSVINRVLSKSYITMLSEEERAGLVKQLKEIVEKGEGKKWIKEDEGVFEYPYLTTLVVMKKL